MEHHQVNTLTLTNTKSKRKPVPRASSGTRDFDLINQAGHGAHNSHVEGSFDNIAATLAAKGAKKIWAIGQDVLISRFVGKCFDAAGKHITQEFDQWTGKKDDKGRDERPIREQRRSDIRGPHKPLDGKKHRHKPDGHLPDHRARGRDRVSDTPVLPRARSVVEEVGKRIRSTSRHRYHHSRKRHGDDDKPRDVSNVATAGNPSTRAAHSTTLSRHELMNALSVSGKMLDSHVKKAEQAKSHHRTSRLQALAKGPEVYDWMESKASDAVVVNCHDSSYHGEEFSKYSNFINGARECFYKNHHDRPIRVFAGGLRDLEPQTSAPTALMRVMCWEMLYRHPELKIDSVSDSDTILWDLGNFRLRALCWLFGRLCERLSEIRKNGKLVVLIDGGDHLERGHGKTRFEDAWAAIRKVVSDAHAGKLKMVVKVLVLFPRSSEVCRKVDGSVKVLDLV